MIEIREITGESEVRAFHAVLHQTAAEGRQNPLITTAESLIARVVNPHPHRTLTMVSAYDGSRVVGVLMSSRSTKNNLHAAEIEIGVVADRRREGIASMMWAREVSVLEADGRTTLLTELNLPAGVGLAAHPAACFYAAHGFVSVHEEDRLILDLPLDERLAADLAAGLGANSGGAVEGADYDVFAWTGPTPDEYVQAMADLTTGMNADVPLGEVDLTPVVVTAEEIRRNDERMPAAGYQVLRAVSRHGHSGQLVAYSQIFVPTSAPQDVLQDDTYVLRAHRGHRLGTRVKLVNLAELARVRPEAQRVQTWTDPDNVSMRRINSDFGFVVVERMHEFQRVR